MTPSSSAAVVASSAPPASPSVAPTTAPTPTQPAVPAPTLPQFEFAFRGTAVGPEAVGLTCCGTAQNDWPGVSDETAITLPDGRVRLYFNKFVPNAPGTPGKKFGILSAISSDGITFTVEKGARIGPDGQGQVAASPFVFRLPDGRYRLFYLQYGELRSSTSRDGLKFTPDPGRRLAGNAFGNFPGGAPVLSAIVPLAQSGYRGYFSIPVEPPSQNSPGKIAVFSATSKDLLAWKPEPGVRLGPGSNQPNDAGHPTVLRVLDDGTLLLIYHSYDYQFAANEMGTSMDRRAGTAEILVRSTDGLTFTDPIITGVYGVEVAYAEGSDGNGFLYVGRADADGGARLEVATVTQVSGGPAINIVDVPPTAAIGTTIGVMVSATPGAVCSFGVRDSAGAALSDPQPPFVPTVGANGIVTWTFALAPTMAKGTATATVTCTAGATRTRDVSFEVTGG